MKGIYITSFGTQSEKEIVRMLSLELDERGVETVSSAENAIIAVVVAQNVDFEVYEFLNELKEKLRTVVLYRNADDGIPDGILAVERPFETEKFCDWLCRRAVGDKDNGKRLNDVLEINGSEVTFGSETIELSRTELAILSVLNESRGKPVSRQELRSVLCKNSCESNTVEVYISYLRAKIDNRFGIRAIATVRGKGYMLI